MHRRTHTLIIATKKLATIFINVSIIGLYSWETLTPLVQSGPATFSLKGWCTIHLCYVGIQYYLTYTEIYDKKRPLGIIKRNDRQYKVLVLLSLAGFSIWGLCCGHC